jgi:hypothetical protein
MTSAGTRRNCRGAVLRPQPTGGVTAAHDEALIEPWSAAGRLVGREDLQRQGGQEGREAHRDVQVRAVAHLAQGDIR